MDDSQRAAQLDRAQPNRSGTEPEPDVHESLRHRRNRRREGQSE